MRRGRDVVVVAVAGAGLGLARPGWDGTIEDRVVATCWWAAALLWAWLTVVAGLHTWATRTGRVRVRRVSGALLPSVVRRRVEQLALAGLLVVPAAAACSDGGAAPAAPVLVLEEATPLEGSDAAPPAEGASSATDAPSSTTARTASTATSTTTTLAPPSTAPPGTAPATTAATTTVAPQPTPTPTPPPGPGGGVDPDEPDPADDPDFVVRVEAGTRVVLRGDSLWSIAAERVAASGGRGEVGRVHRYWTALVEENRATLASGDPDLIHPGEVVRLPALEP